MQAFLVGLVDSESGRRRLAELGVDRYVVPGEIDWSTVREMAEVLDDPQVEAMGYLTTVEHPRLGTFRSMGPPLRMSSHDLPASRPAPELGADSEAVLREAGLSDAEIALATKDG